MKKILTILMFFAFCYNVNAQEIKLRDIEKICEMSNNNISSYLGNNYKFDTYRYAKQIIYAWTYTPNGSETMVNKSYKHSKTFITINTTNVKLYNKYVSEINKKYRYRTYKNNMYIFNSLYYTYSYGKQVAPNGVYAYLIIVSKNNNK